MNKSERKEAFDVLKELEKQYNEETYDRELKLTIHAGSEYFNDIPFSSVYYDIVIYQCYDENQRRKWETGVLFDGEYGYQECLEYMKILIAEKQNSIDKGE